MKALSVKQPWAEWIATGFKTIETRRWKTNYRGPLLICASRKLDSKTIAAYYPYRSKAFITGCAVAVVELDSCRLMVWDDMERARCRPYAGAYSWILKNARRLRAPIPVRGQLGLFNVDIKEEALKYV